MRPAKPVVTCSAIVLQLALLPAALAAAPAPFTSVPSPEARLGLPGALSPADDVAPVAFAQGTEVCVLARENWTLQALRSTDGGRTFVAPVTVAGGPGGKPVADFVTVRAPGGRIHVALVVVDPTIGRGLQHVRSDDLCQHWTAPVDVIAAGSVAHGIQRPEIDAEIGGTVAVMFLGGVPRDIFVVASPDFGATWRPPLTPTYAVGVTPGTIQSLDLAVDEAARIHLAWVTDGPIPWPIYRSRSLDGGQTLTQAVNTAPGGVDSPRDIDLRTAGDGGLLTATWNTSSEWRVRVTRSTDGGVTHPSVYSGFIAGPDDDDGSVRFALSATSSTLLLLATQRDRCSLYRSRSDGLYWDQEATLTDVASPLQEGHPTAVETSAGHWALARTARDGRSILVTASTNDGADWGASRRADDAGAPGMRTAGVIAGVSPDDVFVPWADRRGADQSTGDLRANAAAVSSLAFGADWRIDGSDGAPVPAGTGTGVFVARASATELHAAFTVARPGPQPDVVVASSSDGGRTFGTPVRASTSVSGASVHRYPVLAAQPDGRLYAAYERVLDDGAVEVRANRSLDHGATWLGADLLLGTVTSAKAGRTVPAVSIGAYPSGVVLVAWTDGPSVFVSRSTDSGATFTTTPFSSSPPTSDHFATRLLTQGSQAIVAAGSADYGGSMLAWTSSNQGGQWLRTLTASFTPPFDFPALAGDGSSNAVLAWSSPPLGKVFWARFDGDSWSTPQSINQDALLVTLGYASSSEVLLAYSRYEDRLDDSYVHRSTNGGTTFGAAVRLDDTTPIPAAESQVLAATPDGTGNLWVTWADGSAGELEIVTRLTADGGATWGPPLRLGAVAPQGAYGDGDVLPHVTPSAVPGALVVAWPGPRPDAPLRQVQFNGHDLDDLDRDGVGAAADCDDANAAVYPGAPQVCDGVNNDCDDPAYPTVLRTEIDDDGDRYVECSPWSGGTGGAILGGGDCDDANAAMYPGAPQVCDGVNNDCSDPAWPALPANEADPDGDGAPVCNDNCQTIANPDQGDVDGNGWGNACDQPGFVRAYGAGHDDRATAMVHDGGGRVVMIGSSPFDGSHQELWTTALDWQGEVASSSRRPVTGQGSSPGSWFEADATADGGFVVAGTLPIPAHGGTTNGWLLRFSAAHELVWQHTYGKPGCNEILADVQALADGGFVLAGTDGGDVWIVRTDSSGTVLWERTYGDAYFLHGAHAVRQAPDGGFLVAGSTYDPGDADEYDLLVLRLDGAGAVTWARRLGGNVDDAGRAIAVTPDGGAFVAGYGENRFWVLRFGPDGAVLWQRTYAWGQARALLRLADGNVLVAGTGSGDALILKLDEAGDVLWQRGYGSTGNESFEDLMLSLDGGVLAAGQTTSFGEIAPAAGDAWLVKMTLEGLVETDCAISWNLGQTPVDTTREAHDPGLTAASRTSDVVDLALDNIGVAVNQAPVCLNAGCWDGDADGFGLGAPYCAGTTETDCYDIDPTIYPGAPQLCDGRDTDCRPPSLSPDEADDDGDGFVECSPWEGAPGTTGGDCDDTQGAVYPGAPQVCDGQNNDCDDPSWPALTGAETDVDADGLAFCAGDCNDADPAAHPGAAEACNGADDDCDALTDETCDTRCDFPVESGEEVDLTPDGTTVSGTRVAWTGYDYGVVWSAKVDGGNSEIFFARYDAAFVRIGDVTRVTTAAGTSANATMAWTGTEFGLAWGDTRDGEEEIYFARLDAAGNKLGGDVRVTAAAGVSRLPRIAWSGADYGIVWNDQRDGTMESYFVRVDAAGNLAAGSERRLTPTPYDSSPAKLAWNGSLYGIVYSDVRDGDPELYYQAIDRLGNVYNGETRITYAAGSSIAPSIAWDGASREFGITWVDNRNGPNELFFTRILDWGAKVSPDSRLSGISGSVTSHDLIHSGGEYAIAWQVLAPGTQLEIYFARLANDTINGSELRISDDPASSQAPALEWNGSEYVVIFQDNRVGWNNHAFAARVTCCTASAIGGRAWFDPDRNGIQDAGETGAEGVLVSLHDGAGMPLQETSTGAAGSYGFLGLACGSSYELRFATPAGTSLVPHDQGGDDALDSDPDPATGSTGVFVLTGGADETRWDAGVLPCPPDDAVYVLGLTLTEDANRYAVIHFRDPNWPEQVTGYNVRRSSAAAPPPETWPVVASDVADMDGGTPDIQWIDQSGDVSPTGVWFYHVTAYNHRCPAEGPF